MYYNQTIRVSSKMVSEIIKGVTNSKELQKEHKKSCNIITHFSE